VGHVNLLLAKSFLLELHLDDLFGALVKYLQLYPDVLQKEKWLFGPGVGADADRRRPITADMTDEQIV
jgi:hypothetical protein